MLTGLARRLVVEAINKAAAQGIEEYESGSSRLPKHKHLILGPGAFLMRPHSDGIGEYCMNMVMLARKEDGKLQPLDFEENYTETRNVDVIVSMIREMLGGKAADEEIFSFLKEGMRFKAHMQREVRIMHNLESLEGRAQRAAQTVLDLMAEGRVKVVKLLRQGQTLHEDGE